MEDLKQTVIEFLDTLRKKKGKLSEILGWWNKKYESASKDKDISKKARSHADGLFLLDKHETREVNHRILHFYNESIAFVPNGTEEVATVYGNKSALLRRMRKYKECTTEIDKALKITESSSLKVKLLCRKAECLTALDSPGNRGCLEKARFALNKSNEPEKMKKKLNKLIARTQSTIDADKLEIPTKTKKMVELSRINKAESLDVWDSVEVGYNAKYGKHLIAARDFRPGEKLFVKKAYVNHLDEDKRYMYCSHCWQYLWTAFPCDRCSLRLFCSEECKIEALAEYHDIECSIMVQMVEDSLINDSHLVPFYIRAFAKTLKEAGSIDQLRKDLEFVDQCQDENRRVLSSNGEYKDYHIIYSLPICNTTEKILEKYIGLATISLLAIAKYSSVFNVTYDFTEIDKLMKNDSAIFTGALLLKLSMVISGKCRAIPMTDPSRNNSAENTSNSSKEFQASLSLRSLEYLTVFHCVPNIMSFLTYKDRHVTYALNPIKKGSPLVSALLSIYDNSQENERQEAYRDFFGHSCDCQACVEDWPAILRDHTKSMLEGSNCSTPLAFIVKAKKKRFSEVMALMMSILREDMNPKLKLSLRTHGRLVEKFEERIIASLEGKYSIECELRKEAKEILKELEEKSNKIGFRHTKLLLKTQQLVEKSWEHFPMPSVVTRWAINMMIRVIENLHS